jgi:hypothetical protein
MPGPCFFVRGVFGCDWLQSLAFNTSRRRRSRDDFGVGILPMLVRVLLDCPGIGRWSFRRHRLRCRRDNLSPHASSGQLLPVGLCRFIQDKWPLYLALILRGLDDQRGRRRSDPDRNRRRQANQTKQGEPHLPGHSRTQRCNEGGWELIFKTEFGRLGGK